MNVFRAAAYLTTLWVASSQVVAVKARLQSPPASVFEIEDKQTTQGFKAVCNLYDETKRWFGSGVLVDDKEILTAGHCIDGLAYVSFDNGKTYIKVVKAEANDKFDWFGVGEDIGVAVLERSPGIKPIAIHQVEPEAGRPILQIGYGPDNKKRMTQPNIEIAYKEGDAFYWYPTPSHAIPGDSGGAVLVFDQEDCRYELVAITVTVHWNRFTEQVTLSGATSVYDYTGWINERIEWNLSDPIGLPELPVDGLDASPEPS